MGVRFRAIYKWYLQLGLVADPVIEAIAGLEFEDGLRRESSLEAAGTLVVAAPSPGSILHHPGGAGWSWGRYGCQKDPCQIKFQFCQVPRMGGIKLQLLCGVRIELAVGSLPYPGNYLDFQFSSPWWDRPLSGFPIRVWTWGKIPLGIPTYGRRPLPKPNSKCHLKQLNEKLYKFIDFLKKIGQDLTDLEKQT